MEKNVKASMQGYALKETKAVSKTAPKVWGDSKEFSKENSKESNADPKNMPEKKFSTGAINATIWSNQGVQKTGEAATFKTISLQRRYKDKSGAWKSTTQLRLNDLPKAALVLNKAYEYLVLKESVAHDPAGATDLDEVEVEDVY